MCVCARSHVYVCVGWGVWVRVSFAFIVKQPACPLRGRRALKMFIIIVIITFGDGGGVGWRLLGISF